ncbi:MAG: HAD family phosphatase [Spirochaetaceae bacterium]|jgi:HAD superfamily hydrolase (TIGR01509 family)|nr:HAD family phosphatase [Spirochaetaceae bacterium]
MNGNCGGLKTEKSIYEYRGGIFDLDGTLIDSMHVWDHLCRDWLLSKGKNPAADLERDLAPMTLTQSAGYMSRRYGIDLAPEEMIRQWEGAALWYYKNTIPLKKETADLVRKLYGAGLKLAVVTSCFPAACEAVLKRHDLGPFFSAVLYTDEAPRDKSFPDIWIAAAERLGLESSRCIVFEDTYHALRGARAAGMAFAAVYDDTCKEWELMRAEADWVFGPRETREVKNETA